MEGAAQDQDKCSANLRSLLFGTAKSNLLSSSLSCHLWRWKRFSRLVKSGRTRVLVLNPHRAVIVDGYLESKGTPRMQLMVNFPYLNPIENLWNVVGCAVCKRLPPSANLTELQTALHEKCDDLTLC
ncbi:hypothetical protein CDAR_495581 [Caerostris darwini]|uniref:Tc1-like transposase DDE domain-containing protein n=1 Tax=Caerostris darwini TaxID=1538125 RepID=A0AAV4SD05_9ARAC|nr:hypothetical protein CDAR_495581 [Caerostris darwini]